MRLKKIQTIRLSEDELSFLENMKKEGFSPSTTIRFCINVMMLLKNDKDFKKILKKLSKVKKKV